MLKLYQAKFKINLVWVRVNKAYQAEFKINSVSVRVNKALYPVRLMLKRSFKSVKLVKGLSFACCVLCFITSLVLECTTDNLPERLDLCSPRLKILGPICKEMHR